MEQKIYGIWCQKNHCNNLIYWKSTQKHYLNYRRGREFYIIVKSVYSEKSQLKPIYTTYAPLCNF